MTEPVTPLTDQQQLRDRLADAIRTDLRKGIPGLVLYPGAQPIGRMGRTEYDVADAVLAVVQPKLDRLQAELDRARAELAEPREQVLTEAAETLERIANETEAKVAEYYGPTSGIGPGSADMVREAARTVRGLADRTTSTT
ncbi:hypothetical protein [Kitasatospora sp. McL0602]|uniref:hypothetical protein n=1 Tax=Kitasatospora sp. McL0602 TaxID=3439530 RepID=UPI003F8A391C